ncbi:carbohydrate ABC transporter permease [Paenibacillus eucommiae]|uniref:Aldouronate transport system permease protein n=1 Tax=Paenibacillus eucommiae TaxID=1355755 RepID=A0ABS4IRG4_9BACL|nr:carbohydrate ABC transporter permease [Paenibacillus eucommiae]MBP1990165.1 putative aldouronate transport system permease protein [Paenibacillus eucommiae]
MKRKLTSFDVFLYILLFVLSFTFVYPLFRVLLLSVSDAAELGGRAVWFKSYGFTLESYQYLLKDPSIIRMYLNSIGYAIAYTLVVIVFTPMLAYPLTVSEFKGKKILTIYMLITGYFSGGIVPLYFITRKVLHMYDTIFPIILIGTMSFFTVIIFKSFFEQIPSAIREAAYIDGASHMTLLFQIIMPISKPLIATFVLFSAIASWNNYFIPYVFLDNKNLWPINLQLTRLIQNATIQDAQSLIYLKDFQSITTRTIQSAVIIIVMVPILCVYPFLQKYFTKGMTLGAVKS